MKMIKNKKGFSLVELLAVLVILALIAILVGGTVVKLVKKSEQGVTESQEKAILNAAEKWSINNSYVFDDIEGKKMQVGLDVVFIIDVSTSMTSKMVGTNGESITRYEATVNAINNALEVLKENDKNRVGFVFYSGLVKSGSSCANALGTADSTCSLRNVISLMDVNNVSDLTTGKSSWNGSSTKVPTIIVNGKASQVNGGTYTLVGIQSATNMLVASGEKGRVPVIILLTDGEPTFGRKINLEDPFTQRHSSLGNGATKTFTDDNSGRTKNSEVVWANIKTSYLAKEKVSTAYGTTAFYYTIGLGIASNYGTFMLNPTSENLNVLKNGSEVDKNLFNFMAGKSDYYYPTNAFVGQMTEDELKSHFQEIATQVTEATVITEVCVSVQELYDSGYLSTTDVKLSSGLNAKDEYVIMSFNEATNQYVYAFARSDEQKAICAGS